MKQSILRDTLAFQLGMRPAVQLRDMSPFSTLSVSKSIKKYEALTNVYEVCGSETAFSEKPMGNAERDGLIFYMMNHAVSVVRTKAHEYEPLGKYLPILQAYHEELAVRTSRMFFYMLLICTRESRHDGNMKSETAKHDVICKPYGSAIQKFHRSLNGAGSGGAADRLRTHPPDAPIGDYTRFLSDIFYKGSYPGGYGGPAWGKVADVLRDYTIGKISAEMMMDTAFTLCHNGGPIFNKGMLFESSFADIYKILDVQRSGQIPQLIAEKATPHANDEAVQRLFKLCLDILGKDFVGAGYVDWYKVEELGALKKYPSQKAAQANKHGVPEGSKKGKKVKLPHYDDPFNHDGDEDVTANDPYNTGYQLPKQFTKPKLTKSANTIEVFPGMFILKKERTPA